MTICFVPLGLSTRITELYATCPTLVRGTQKTAATGCGASGNELALLFFHDRTRSKLAPVHNKELAPCYLRLNGLELFTEWCRLGRKCIDLGTAYTFLPLDFNGWLRSRQQ
jgi:hypothetical protein